MRVLFKILFSYLLIIFKEEKRILMSSQTRLKAIFPNLILLKALEVDCSELVF